MGKKENGRKKILKEYGSATGVKRCCQTALSNGIVKWHCQMAMSNSVVKQHCQMALSHSVVKQRRQATKFQANQLKNTNVLPIFHFKASRLVRW